VPQLITASFCSPVTHDAPESIVYIPVGANRISATVDGKPKALVVNVPVDQGENIAATLQAALTQRLANSVRPRLAFDHARKGPASGHPTGFSFDPEKGIILAASWSKSGRAAIEGGDYGYFSPTFLINRDGNPSGLPPIGEIGSLVDEPAFRSIGLIAAADSQDETQPQIMSKLIFAALSVSPTDENAESNALSKISALNQDLSASKSALSELESTLTATVAKLEALNKARAEGIVRAAVSDGRLLAMDTHKQDIFLAKIEAGDAFAEEILASLPVLNKSLTDPIVLGSDGKPSGDPDKFKGLTGISLLEAALAEEFEASNK
jgi:phage I-like protein